MSKEFIKQVANNLKQIRKENKVSAVDIAGHLGITEASYYNIEAGKTELKISRIKEIAELLDVPVSLIMGEYTESPLEFKDRIKTIVMSLREEINHYQNLKP